MNANKITDHLWLGNYESAKDEAFLRANDIKFVVNCTRDLAFPDFYRRLGITVVRLPINDIDTPDNNAVLVNDVDAIIDQVRGKIQSKQNVLVHCFAGISRSATTVACYLVKYYKFRYDLAILFIRFKRPIAFTPRPMFGRFLKGYKGTHNLKVEKIN